MKKLLAVLLTLLMTCASAVGPAAAEAVEPVTLNVAYMPNYGSLWAVEAAIHKEFMAAEGITVNLVEFADGPTIIAAMESGSIDVGYIGQGAHKLCINGRASIFALSHISNGDMLIGGKDHHGRAAQGKARRLFLRHLLRGHSRQQPAQIRHDDGRYSGV